MFPKKIRRSKNFRNSNQKGPEVPQDPDVPKRSGCFLKIRRFPKNLEVPKKIPKASLHRKKSGSVTKNPEVPKKIWKKKKYIYRFWSYVGQGITLPPSSFLLDIFMVIPIFSLFYNIRVYKKISFDDKI